MPAAKFKVGDRIRIKDKEHYALAGIAPAAGRKGIVTHVLVDGSGYRVHLDSIYVRSNGLRLYVGLNDIEHDREED